VATRRLTLIKVGLIAQLSFILIYTNLKGQSIGYYTGIFDYHFKEINPIVNQIKHYKTDTYQGLIIDYPINDKLSINFSYANYSGWSSFAAEDELSIIGNGSAYTRLNRYGLQANWNILSYKKYVSVSPYLRIDYERNDVQISGLTNSFNYIPDPNNNYEGSIFVETFNGGQALPSLGLRISLRPFWRIWIFGDVFYSIGNKTHQRYYFDYSYKGIPQERAEWHSQGSGFVKTIGIGIQLWDENKRKNRR